MIDRRSLLLPGIVVATAFAVLIALGLWQLERKAWKENLIATLAERMSAPPTRIPPPEQWASLDQARDEFRRVSGRASFARDLEARVYTGGGGLRDDIKGPGYFVFAPARLNGLGGSAVVINRGYVPNTNPDASLRPIDVPENPVGIVGVLRWPEPPGSFVTPYSERQNLWFVRDHGAMWIRHGWGNDSRYHWMQTAPFYIEMESPAPQGGVPRPGPLTVKLRNDHLGYAMTWFGLAAVLVVVFGFWAAARRRQSA